MGQTTNRLRGWCIVGVFFSSVIQWNQGLRFLEKDKFFVLAYFGVEGKGLGTYKILGEKKVPLLPLLKKESAAIAVRTMFQMCQKYLDSCSRCTQCSRSTCL